ncbi:hypothetical protein SMACR_08426 [Sordaria macrospora]|nr:hypothetical protein SMACR_08426 [Sordaria macrospora]WPJ64221.1 hypothetical protein SMAC4_08426 [Sordaria macrospora]
MKRDQRQILIMQQDVEELRRGLQQIATQAASGSSQANNAQADDDMDMMEGDMGPDELAALGAAEAAALVATNSTTQLSTVMRDGISGLIDCVSTIEIPPKFVFAALVRLYDSSGDARMLEKWERFQKQGLLDQSYCLHGILYWGHDDHRVANASAKKGPSVVAGRI